MALQGADLEKMAALAKRLEVASSQLHRITTQATVAATTIHHLWVGPDGVDAHRRWMSVHRPRLIEAAAVLGEASATVERNRQTQEATSALLLEGVAGYDEVDGDG